MDRQRSGRARREGRMWEAWRWLIECGLGRLYSHLEQLRSGTAAMKADVASELGELAKQSATEQSGIVAASRSGRWLHSYSTECEWQCELGFCTRPDLCGCGAPRGDRSGQSDRAAGRWSR